jgi:hypothetical protein
MANEETAKDTPSGKEESPAPASLDLNASMEKAYEETVGTTDAAQAAPPATPPAEPAKPEILADKWADFDPDKLPQEALNKLFTKFQPKLSERAEAFNREKEGLADRIISAWEKQNGGAPAPPSIEAQVKAAIDEGDTEKALLIAQAPLNERLSRIEMAEAQQRAYNTALSFDPSIKENDAEIAQRLSADPQIARMAAANGFAAAPLVLRGINAVIQNEKLQKELAAVKTTIDAQVKAGVEKAIAERQELVRKAGTGLTQGGRILNPNTDRKMDLQEAMETAWAENAS